ncbi:interleukin-26 isoform X2 [Megalobrama amblycephala]|uniref:interleukin-26 isoform X2 n=1 Tax=Megalobrama amblycephala TaxID=75352 RepID=UPI0020147403|nr:interleukin-26 isoform X2 [Megalobrama amblycephala]
MTVSETVFSRTLFKPELDTDGETRKKLQLLECNWTFLNGHKQEECLNNNIQLPMIKDMINTSELIEQPLDKDNKPFHSILRNLKKNCYKKLNVADFKRILEIYDEHVFQKMWKNDTRQSTKMFMDSFKRLQDVIENCEPKGKKILSICARENLKTIEDTLMMDEPGVRIKAMREFRSVLVWITLAMDRRRTHEKIQ